MFIFLNDATYQVKRLYTGRKGLTFNMLTSEEFHAWCLRNALSAEAEAYIQRIRSSQPVRKVRSGISNICGRYPSVKMGHTIQFGRHCVAQVPPYDREMALQAPSALLIFLRARLSKYVKRKTEQYVAVQKPCKYST